MSSPLMCVHLILHERDLPPTASWGRGGSAARARRPGVSGEWPGSHPASSLPSLRAPLRAWVAPGAGPCAGPGWEITADCSRSLARVGALITAARAEPAPLWVSVWFLRAVSTEQMHHTVSTQHTSISRHPQALPFCIFASNTF